MLVVPWPLACDLATPNCFHRPILKCGSGRDGQADDKAGGELSGSTLAATEKAEAE